MNRWTAADDARLRELYPITRTSELPALLGRSRMAIKVRAANMHLRKDPEVSMRREWHPDEDAVIRMLYVDTPTDGIAAVLNRSLSSTFQRARKLGLEKDPEFIRETGRFHAQHPNAIAHRFRKGQVPANKGVKRPKGWAPGRMRETQFKKGQRGTRWMPIGSTRLIGGYEYTKVSDVRSTHRGRGFVPYTVNWKLSHVLLWERKRGRVPKGHALVFKDGDRTHIRLGNLKLVPRAELMRRNTIWNRYPREVASAIQLVGALNRKINRRNREEQDRRSA